MLKIKPLSEKNLSLHLLVSIFFIFHTQQLSAANCHESFKNISRWHAFLSSSLSDKNVLRVTGLKSGDLKESVLLDIASGQTAFVKHAMEEGAKSALAVDLIDRPDNIPENLYLQRDITQLDSEDITDRTGALADLTIALSVFGYLEADTELWLQKLTAFTRPGGRIILDFTVPQSSVVRNNLSFILNKLKIGRITEEDAKELIAFENFLHKLKVAGSIKGFRRKHKNSWLWYSSVGGKRYLKKFKRTSFTYDIITSSKETPLQF